MASLSSPPGSPSLLAGFLDLRGDAIPVLHLDRLFNLSEQLPGLHTPLVILHGAPTGIGILVEAVRQIIPITQAAFRPLPQNNVFHDCATAAFKLNGDVVYLLSAGRILLEKERRVLAEFQAVAQERLRHLEEYV